MNLEYRLLGPLEVHADGRLVPINSAKQRVLLATLLVHAGRVVSTDELIHRLWGDDIPAGARNTLQSYVARLRRTLGTDTAITTRPDGYLVETPTLDTTQFEALVEAARTADDPGKPLREALDLWRGEPLANVPSDLRHDIAAVWQERRLAALEQRIDADLKLGRHHDVTSELADLTTHHPDRERFWAQRMLALYRSGRPAEALHCYTLVRTHLADELGVDPGPELRDLHQAVLAQDPSLATPVPAARGRRNDLPGDIPDFVGRTDEFDQLVALLPTQHEPAPTVVITAIDGMAGVGKTTLAVHAAHRLARHYPDGQLFLDLRGHTPEQEPIEAGAALAILLRALGVATDRIPADLAERSALWRAKVADRKVLLVLDNASTSQQVRPLLPGSPNCLALITSRRRLADLDTAETLSLDVLSETDALTLFTSVVGADRMAAEPEAAADVLRLCGYLPLAVRIAASRLRTRPAWPVRALAERLGDELAVGDRSVTAALSLSHQRLDERQRHLFALLGQHPGVSFDRYQAAALADTDGAVAQQTLDELIDVHLVQEPTPGRYRFHDLVRHYARTKTSMAEPIRHAAVGRLLDHYRYVAHAVDVQLNPVTPEPQPQPPGPMPVIVDSDTAIEWCEAELANLTAVINHAAAYGWRSHARQIVNALYWFFKLRGYTTEWIECLTIGLDASQDDNDRANLLRHLGHAHYAGGDHPRSLGLLQQALALFRQTGDRLGEGTTLGNIGVISFHARRFTEAIEYHEQELAVREETGNSSGVGLTLGNIAYAYQELGRMAECLDYAGRALDFCRRTGDRRGEGVALGNIAWAHLRLAHDPMTALSYARQALAIDREVGDRRNEMCVVDTIGLIYRELGDYTTALEYLNQALAMALELGSNMFEDEFRTNILNTYLLATEAGS